MTIKIKQATKNGYIKMINGGVCDLSFIKSNKRRGRVQGGVKYVLQFKQAAAYYI